MTSKYLPKDWTLMVMHEVHGKNMGIGSASLISRRALARGAIRGVLALNAVPAVALLVGCSSASKIAGNSGAGIASKRQSGYGLSEDDGADASIRAMGLIGTPYRYGGNSPIEGFDCSGFIRYIYAMAARQQTPRTVRSLHAWVKVLRPDQARAGDLVFFGTGNEATHAGIYVGQDRFVHSPSTGGRVRLDSTVSAYWRRQFMNFGRP